jgi:hypothetical protein
MLRSRKAIRTEVREELRRLGFTVLEVGDFAMAFVKGEPAKFKQRVLVGIDPAEPGADRSMWIEVSHDGNHRISYASPLGDDAKIPVRMLGESDESYGKRLGDYVAGRPSMRAATGEDGGLLVPPHVESCLRTWIADEPSASLTRIATKLHSKDKIGKMARAELESRFRKVDFSSCASCSKHPATCEDECPSPGDELNRAERLEYWADVENARSQISARRTQDVARMIVDLERELKDKRSELFMTSERLAQAEREVAQAETVLSGRNESLGRLQDHNTELRRGLQRMTDRCRDAEEKLDAAKEYSNNVDRRLAIALEDGANKDAAMRASTTLDVDGIDFQLDKWRKRRRAAIRDNRDTDELVARCYVDCLELVLSAHGVESKS